VQWTSSRAPASNRFSIAPQAPAYQDIERHVCYLKQYLAKECPAAFWLQRLGPSELAVAAAANSISRRSLRALATVVFGNHHNQPAIISRGYEDHIIVLKMLSEALAAQDTSDEVILSIIALALLESLVPTSTEKANVKHIRGLERVLELRGPSLLDSAEGWATYKGARHMILLASYRLKTPVIASRATWQQASALHCLDGAEQQQQYLYDVIASSTAFAATTTAQSERDSTHNDQDEGVAGQLMHDLLDWRERWDQDHPNVAEAIAQAASVDVDSLGQAMTPSMLETLHSLSDNIKVMLALYDSALIFVLGAGGASDESITAQRLAALRIFSYLPECFAWDSCMLSQFPPILPFASIIAWFVLRDDDAAKEWMASVIAARKTHIGLSSYSLF
jgi:hypothetical protein